MVERKAGNDGMEEASKQRRRGGSEEEGKEGSRSSVQPSLRFRRNVRIGAYLTVASTEALDLGSTSPSAPEPPAPLRASLTVPKGFAILLEILCPNVLGPSGAIDLAEYGFGRPFAEEEEEEEKGRREEGSGGFDGRRIRIGVDEEEAGVRRGTEV